MSQINITLSEAELLACQPVVGEGGRVLRAFCPFHGSDHQRSLRVTLATGRFVCFACEAWGYLEEARQRWQAERQRTTTSHSRLQKSPPALRPLPSQPLPGISSSRLPPLNPPKDAAATLAAALAAFQAALPGSRGATYLLQRGIPLAVAQQVGVGYAPPGTWPHQIRDWKWGRVVIPHTTPDGQLVNLYGRAVGTLDDVPKGLRHDHLPGQKGYFNAVALHAGPAPVWVCEGAFDALALLAAGYPQVVAIFGVHGWRWEWAREISQVVFALDADSTGQHHWRLLARQAALRGKRVIILPPTAYGGEKDINAAWMAGVLQISLPPSGGMSLVDTAFANDLQDLWEERAAIMEWDGGLTRGDAEAAAWQRLQPPPPSGRCDERDSAPVARETPCHHATEPP